MNPDEKECPFCFEVIKTAAVKCKHCGSMLNNQKSNDVPAVYGLEGDEKLRVQQEALLEAEIEHRYKQQKREIMYQKVTESLAEGLQPTIEFGRKLLIGIGVFIFIIVLFVLIIIASHN